MVKSAARKVVLFIVEGISDRNALEPIISEIVKTDQVLFEFTNGDITSDYKKNTSNNIVKTITDIVNAYLNRRSFHVDDLLEIIQIVDTDGAFVKEPSIIHHDKNENTYEDKYIYTSHPKEMWMRNIIKSNILNKLVTQNKLAIRKKQIPYSIYYMSCNLDHVLYDERNLEKTKKVSKSLEFSDKFEDEEYRFIEFMNRFMISKNIDYIESWKLIQHKFNSLQRYSNLWLYLKKFT
ncbi:MAG: hypothetical protein WC907_02885 [Acholeplasmataceae bacterium]